MIYRGYEAAANLWKMDILDVKQYQSFTQQIHLGRKVEAYAIWIQFVHPLYACYILDSLAIANLSWRRQI